MANVKKRWKPDNRQKFEALKNFFQQTDFDTFQNLETTTKLCIAEIGLKIGEALPILRLSLMGTMQGPDLFKTAHLLGKQEVIQRLETAFQKFDN
jgi:glutamyl-tRNA synthetase